MNKNFAPILCSIIAMSALAGCAGHTEGDGVLAQVAFSATTRQVNWTGSLADSTINKSVRVDRSQGQAIFTAVASAQDSDFHIEATYDTGSKLGANARVTVRQGKRGAFEGFVSWASNSKPAYSMIWVFDADFSDGKEHVFQLPDGKVGAAVPSLRLRVAS